MDFLWIVAVYFNLVYLESAQGEKSTDRGQKGGESESEVGVEKTETGEED